MGSGGGRHLLEDRRKGEADSAADRVDGRAWRGAQARPATILFDIDFAEVDKIVDDALPFEPAATGGEPVEKLLAQDKGEEGAEDVAADAGVGFVEDRAGGEQRLCGFEGVLHGQQIAVAQHDLERGDLGVGAQHEETVEPGIGLDLGAVDDKAAARGRLQEATKTLVGDERLVALGELALETGDDFGARRGVLFGFLLVAADDVAPPGDRRLPDRQFGLAFLAGNDERHGEAIILDDPGAHLAAGAFAHAEDVLDLLGFEGGDGIGTDHAAIGNDASIEDPKALAQPFDYWQQQRHVGRVAGHHKGRDRPVGVVKHDAEHDLLQVTAIVFGVAVLA